MDDILATLKLGGNVYPQEAITSVGVDLTGPEVVATVMVRWNEILTETEKLLLARESPGSRSIPGPAGRGRQGSSYPETSVKSFGSDDPHRPPEGPKAVGFGGHVRHRP